MTTAPHLIPQGWPRRQPNLAHAAAQIVERVITIQRGGSDEPAKTLARWARKSTVQRTPPLAPLDCCESAAAHFQGGVPRLADTPIVPEGTSACIR